MRRSHWLLLVTAALAFYGVGTIWLVQLSAYPLWAYVGRDHFSGYHLAWWHTVWGVIFLPAGVKFIASIFMIWLRPPEIPRWSAVLGVALEVVAFVLTAVYWGPLQANLATPDGLSLPLFHELLFTHWLRVALFTAYAVLLFWMLARVLAGGLERRRLHD